MADELRRCRRELLLLIQLIMSKKSKEAMQTEALRHIILNESGFHEYVLAVISKADDTGTETAQSSLANDNASNRTDLWDTDGSVNIVSSVQREENEDEGEETSKEKKRPKQRKSKYENVDFSHIYREPKTSKYKKMANKAATKPTQKDSLKDSENIVRGPTKNNISENNRIAMISAIMNALLQSRCQQTQNSDTRSCLQNNLDPNRCRSHDRIAKLKADRCACQLNSNLHKSAGKRKHSSSFIPSSPSDDESKDSPQPKKGKVQLIYDQDVLNLEKEQDVNNCKVNKYEMKNAEEMFLNKSSVETSTTDQLQCEDLDKRGTMYSGCTHLDEKSEFDLDAVRSATPPSAFREQEQLFVIEDIGTSVTTNNSADIFFVQDQI